MKNRILLLLTTLSIIVMGMGNGIKIYADTYTEDGINIEIPGGTIIESGNTIYSSTLSGYYDVSITPCIKKLYDYKYEQKDPNSNDVGYTKKGVYEVMFHIKADATDAQNVPAQYQSTDYRNYDAFFWFQYGGTIQISTRKVYPQTGANETITTTIPSIGFTVRNGDDRYITLNKTITLTESEMITTLVSTIPFQQLYAPYNVQYITGSANQTPPYDIVYINKGETVYLNKKQYDAMISAMGGSGGSGGSGGISQTDWEELLDTINNAETVVSIDGKLDTIIELLGESLDSTTAEQMEDQAEIVQQTTQEAIQQEQQYTEDMQDQLDDINVNEYTGILSNGKFMNSMRWIRQVHLETVENTELGGIVSLILIIGLAVYLIGRRSG